MTLGQKIRALRKQKGWTQAALAGEEITRNMLSRIESDAALPSLPTLLYLAERLSVPAGYFLSDSTSLLSVKKEELFPALKSCYSRGNYAEVVRLFRRDFTEVDDEIAYLVAQSALMCAKESMHRGNMRIAADYLQLSLEFSEKTIYTSARLKALIALLSSTLENIQMPRFSLTASPYEALSNEAMWEDLYRYLSEKTENYTFTDELLAEHVAARATLAAGKYKDALVQLRALEDKRSLPGFSILVLFRLYGDLESCYKELGDFEKAYRYASKRLSLLSAFRK